MATAWALAASSTFGLTNTAPNFPCHLLRTEEGREPPSCYGQVLSPESTPHAMGSRHSVQQSSGELAMGRLVKSFLAVAAIAGASLATMLTADAQRIGAQKWAADAGTLVQEASVSYECRGCPWHGAQCTPRARNYRTCDPRCESERPRCSRDTRWDRCRNECVPLARPGGLAGPPPPGQPYRPPQPPYVPAPPPYAPPPPASAPAPPPYVPAQPRCPQGTFWDGRICACPPGTSYVPAWARCAPLP
jgi:hypothetical protein